MHVPWIWPHMSDCCRHAESWELHEQCCHFDLNGLLIYPQSQLQIQAVCGEHSMMSLSESTMRKGLCVLCTGLERYPVSWYKAAHLGKWQPCQEGAEHVIQACAEMKAIAYLIEQVDKWRSVTFVQIQQLFYESSERHGSVDCVCGLCYIGKEFCVSHLHRGRCQTVVIVPNETLHTISCE